MRACSPRSLLILAPAVLALTLPSRSAAAQSQSEPLCSLDPISYQNAKQSYPEAVFALAQLEQHSIATWYSDRNGDYVGMAKQLVSTCPESSRLSIVIYGLPNKDCEARSSAVGSTVVNSDDYKQFIQALVKIVGDRKALYVLEPDAVGLLAKDSGCGAQAGYRDNLLLAIELLAANPNAEIYLDVGYWTLEYPESTARVTQVVKDLTALGRVKGITLNTSNFRSTAEMSQLCANFQESVGTDALHCIVDTSRNHNGSPSTEWCNVRSAGIGHPPTSETGFSNLDYFMWIKPPGESDGKCDTGTHNADAMAGPDPGLFFKDSFKLLWNQGYFVKELGLPEIVDGTILPVSVTASPSPTPPIPAEVTSSLAPMEGDPDTSLSPTMAPFPAAQEQLVEETPAAPATDSAPADADNVPSNVAPSAVSPCPPIASGDVTAAAAVAAAVAAASETSSPCPSRPSARLTPAEVEHLASVQQRSTRGALDAQPLSPELQQQMDEIAFNTAELLRMSDGGYDDVVGILATTEDFEVREVPENVFFGVGVASPFPFPSDGGSSSGSRDGGSQADEVTKISLMLGSRGGGDASGSSSVSALSIENLASGSAKEATATTDSQASTSTDGGSRGGTNRTEVLATLAVLAVVGALAVAMAVIARTREKAALMNARLSTPETTIIHITPAGVSVV